MKTFNSSMKIKIISLLTLVFVTSILLFLNGCEEEGEHLPSVETYDPLEVHYMKALMGGRVVSDHGFPVTTRGFCFAKGKVPNVKDDVLTIGSGSGIFQGYISDLEPGTEYYVRAFATSKKGTGYGSIMVLTTKQITDPDGNVYKYVKIGNQIWMKENLATTMLNDSSPIARGSNSSGPGIYPYYCFYDHDSAKYSTTYGKLYSFYAVSSGKLCPLGWKVPSVADWDQLNNFLGGSQVAGGKLKEKDTTNWQFENIGATNEVGFTARPGGMQTYTSIFQNIRVAGYFWTSDTTSSSLYDAYCQQLYYNSVVILRLNENRTRSMSVRCILDQ